MIKILVDKMPENYWECPFEHDRDCKLNALDNGYNLCSLYLSHKCRYLKQLKAGEQE